MYLKSLNIVGFKTFAEETEIRFDPGFTAVVGPNGSGKSNIVDSIKWVFGEKSAKGLRGEKMDDVIFHGTDARKPAGYAEVSIAFDNSDRNIHLDYPSVKITRRLYPDGTNEYYVNDTKMIRKEVEKILLDTGIGKVNYSIMEQGKVDRILYAKPEERRSLFEEAAGVSKFKLERQEALKKLNDTRQNLLRIHDILNGMEKELELKQGQAEKAEVYFKLKADLNDADKKLRYLKIQQISSRLKQTEQELDELKKKNQDILQSIDEETRRITDLDKEKISLESKVTDIDKKLMEFLSLNKMQKEKAEHTRTIITEYIERISSMAEELTQEKDRILDLENEISRENEFIRICREDIAAKEIKQNEIVETLLAKESEIEQENSLIRANLLLIEENDREHNALREKLKEVILEIISELEEKKREAFRDHAEREELKSSILQQIEGYILLRNEIEASGSEWQFTVKKWNFEDLKGKYQLLIEKEDEFRNLFFHKNSILREKEVLDARIEDLILENDTLARNNKDSYHKIEILRNEIEGLKNDRVDLEKKILEQNGKKEISEASILKTRQRLEEVHTRINHLEKSREDLKSRKTEYEAEIEKIEAEIEESYNQFLGMSRLLESEKENLRTLTSSIQEIKNTINQNQENFKNLLPLLTDLERGSTGLKVQLDSQNEELYNDYTLSFEELSSELSETEIVKSREEQRLRNIKGDLQNIGSVNPIAVEEYNNIREIYEHNRSQKEDIEKSKRDVEDVLAKLNEKSEKIFKEVFDQITIHFQDTFSTLFGGGKATLELVDTGDALNSGIEILAEPPGKHVQNLRLLSGGEKSLTAIALLFAIYMVKPSPFCFLDEIDAALDEINKNRFCNILDKFKNNTQFIVISHAQSTISRANTIFGVTNENAGVSKIVSLRLEEAEELTEKLSKAV